MPFIEFGVSLIGMEGFPYPDILTGLFFLYIGPETILPLTSFIAAIVGFFLMFWRWVVGSCKRCMKFCSRTISRICGKEIEEEVSEPVADLPVEKNEEVSNGKS